MGMGRISSEERRMKASDREKEVVESEISADRVMWGMKDGGGVESATEGRGTAREATEPDPSCPVIGAMTKAGRRWVVDS
jgi:hypothetical protein